MRRSEFWRAISDEFGESYGAVLVADLSLGTMGGRTAQQAIENGDPPRDVWLALCDAMEVPLARRHGAGRLEPKR